MQKIMTEAFTIYKRLGIGDNQLKDAFQECKSTAPFFLLEYAYFCNNEMPSWMRLGMVELNWLLFVFFFCMWGRVLSISGLTGSI